VALTQMLDHALIAFIACATGGRLPPERVAYIRTTRSLLSKGNSWRAQAQDGMIEQLRMTPGLRSDRRFETRPVARSGAACS
jgi:hypothetical protein